MGTYVAIMRPDMAVTYCLGNTLRSRGPIASIEIRSLDFSVESEARIVLFLAFIFWRVVQL